MFDFDKAEKEANAKAPNTAIAAVVMGQSSAGKSYLCGTLPGKTLFLYTQAEDHGRDSAKLAGGSLVPVALDLVDGELVNPDVAYARLLDLLQPEGIKKAKFDSVVLDGLTELERLVRGTSEWKRLCLTTKGAHDGFQEHAATMALIAPVMEALRTLQRKLGTHYVTTCIMMVKETSEDGEILASEPILTGFKVPSLLIPTFPDQIVIGRMTNAEGVTKPRLQFNAKVTKASKEANGAIKKFMGFTPRLRGVADLPATMPADFKAVLKLKQGK